MIRRLKFIALVVLLATAVTTFGIGRSRAANQTITCDNNGCGGASGSLFNANNMAPDGRVNQTVIANNNYNEDRTFAVEIKSGSLSDSTPSLADKYLITIREQESGLIVYGPKSITRWRDDGFIGLSNVPSEGTRHYDFTVVLENVGNDYQNKNISFDLNFGFDQLNSGGGIGGALGESTTSEVEMGTTGLVMGEWDEKKTEAVPEGLLLSGEVFGDQTSVCNSKNWWWLVLLAQAILSLIYLFLTKKNKKRKWFLVVLGLSLLSQIAHLKFGCACAGEWCNRYIWLNLGILATMILVDKFAFKIKK